MCWRVAYRAIAAGALLFVTQTVLATAFYERSAEGWFWYIDPTPEIEEEIEQVEAPPPEPEPIEDEPRPPAPAVAAESGPAPLSSEWLRQNLQVYLDRAIDDPSPENVRAYYYLQRVTLERAQRFSETAQRVVIGDPLLDQITARPTATAAARSMDGDARQQMMAVLQELWTETGVAFFFAKDCATCVRQARLLQRLHEQRGLQILAISVDGSPVPEGLVDAQVRIDSGEAEILGVQSYPALFLLKPPAGWAALGQGAIGEDELYQRMILASVQNGWIDEETYNRTRPMNRMPEILLRMAEGDQLPDDPAELVRVLSMMEERL